MQSSMQFHAVFSVRRDSCGATRLTSMKEDEFYSHISVRDYPLVYLLCHATGPPSVATELGHHLPPPADDVMTPTSSRVPKHLGVTRLTLVPSARILDRLAIGIQQVGSHVAPAPSCLPSHREVGSDAK